MKTTERVPEQTDLTTKARRLDRHMRGPLGTLTLIALLGYTLMNFVAFFRALLVDGNFVPPILVFAVLLLLVSGIVAIPWRWTPLFGAGMSLLTATFVLLQPHNTGCVAKKKLICYRWEKRTPEESSWQSRILSNGVISRPT